MFFYYKIEMTVLASSAYKLHSFSEVTAFFIMSLWSCDQLSLLLKCRKTPGNKWLPQGNMLHHLPKEGIGA